jgi:hypothetical protein
MMVGMSKDEINLSVLMEDRKCGACPPQLRSEPQIDDDSIGGELDALGRQLRGNTAQGLDRGQR